MFGALATIADAGLPNTRFEKGLEDLPDGWRLTVSDGGDWLRNAGLDGSSAIRVTGKGSSSGQWRSNPVELATGRCYVFSFWSRGNGSGCVTSGIDDMNVDWGCAGEQWTQRLNVLRTPDRTGAYSTAFHLGQWMMDGEALFDNLRLVPVKPVYAKAADLELGHGEQVDGNRYSFASQNGAVSRNHARTLVEPVGKGYVQVNPPYPPATTEEMDACWDLPFTKLPHPRYKGKRIPAYDMIKDSIITHRGCFGGCNFCTIAAHQGKFIQSRSERSILEEVRKLAAMPEFHGNISDLGAPTANMYGLHGKNQDLCAKCRRQSCLFPAPCPNMDRSHERVLKLYRAVDSVKGIRHSYIGSGVRYDLFLDEKGFVDETGKPYLRELMLKHTSGRLKVAPEHTEDKVLHYMGKPSFKLFERLRKEFDKINRENGTHTELVPYFISSHPGCTLDDMKRLAANPCLKGIWMEQVQHFMPTPMTTSSVMFYSGIDPRTMKPVFVERDPMKKKAQKALFFKK